MKTFNGLKTQNGCSGCASRAEGSFCNLPESNLAALEPLKITKTYPKGATLFFEGQPSDGIYVLCRGLVKLSTCSRDGKAIILRIARAGQVLGLSATISDSVYEATAKVLAPSLASFVRKPDFLNFLRENPEACFNAAKQLSYVCQTASAQVCSLGLSGSVAERLAKLILGWSKTNGAGSGSAHIKNTFTHEEIAEMIGTTRETISRLLKDFKDKNLITIKGSNLTVHDKDKLEAIVNRG